MVTEDVESVSFDSQYTCPANFQVLVGSSASGVSLYEM